MWKYNSCHLNKILVIRTGAIGDCILTIPVLEALYRQWPSVLIDILGTPNTSSLLVHHKIVRAIISIDLQQFTSLFIPNASFPSSLINWCQQYDLILSFLPDEDGVLSKNLNRIRPAISQRPNLYQTEQIHITHHLKKILIPLGMNTPASPPEILPIKSNTSSDGPDKKFLFDIKTNESSTPIVAIHPGSGGDFKCWPISHFARLIDWLSNQNIQVLVTAGPADRDRIQRLKGVIQSPHPIMVNNHSLPELSEILSHCHLMIGNDSGITHLAASLNIPTMALFGPTNPFIWGPRGKDVRIFWGEWDFTGDIGTADTNFAPTANFSLGAIDFQNLFSTIKHILNI